MERPTRQSGVVTRMETMSVFMLPRAWEGSTNWFWWSVDIPERERHKQRPVRWVGVRQGGCPGQREEQGQHVLHQSWGAARREAGERNPGSTIKGQPHKAFSEDQLGCCYINSNAKPQGPKQESAARRMWRSG